jgi:hypothetical protein
MDQNWINVFAAGFVCGMGFMAVAVICFVSAVRHLLHLTKSDLEGPFDETIGRQFTQNR